MHEVNPSVQRRQRVVEQVRSVQPVVPNEVPQPGVDLYPGLLGDLADWMVQFWTALDEDRCDAERACVLTGQLLGRVDAIKAVQRLRPWRELCQAVEDTLTSVHGVSEATLNAYAAPTPAQAQRAERVLQDHIDAASSALDRWSVAFDRLELMVGRSPEELAIAMLSLAMDASSDTVLVTQRITRAHGSSTDHRPNLVDPRVPAPGRRVSQSAGDNDDAESI